LAKLLLWWQQHQSLVGVMSWQTPGRLLLLPRLLLLLLLPLFLQGLAVLSGF
jgi:hypothetical protein